MITWTEFLGKKNEGMDQHDLTPQMQQQMQQQPFGQRVNAATTPTRPQIGTPVSQLGTPEQIKKWSIPNAKPGEPNLRLPMDHPDVQKDLDGAKNYMAQLQAQGKVNPGLQQQQKRPWWKPGFLGQ